MPLPWRRKPPAIGTKGDNSHGRRAHALILAGTRSEKHLTYAHCGHFPDRRVPLPKLRESLRWLLSAIILTLAAGCDQPGRTPPGQIAARVGATEISVHQINAILARMSDVRPENVAQVRRDILDKLIEQQLAVQQAIEMHLDRTPDVMQMLEAARRDVLARAYQSQITSALPVPTADDIHKFYVEHPELFADRRIFVLREISLTADPAILAWLKPLIAEGQSLDSIATLLKTKGLRVEINAVARPAEQIPFEFLPRYLNLKIGQTMLIEAPATLLLTHLVDFRIHPLDEETATPRIKGFLANQNAAEAVAREMKQLRAKAKIELVGEFSIESPSSLPGAHGEKDGAIAKGVGNLK